MPCSRERIERQAAERAAAGLGVRLPACSSKPIVDSRIRRIGGRTRDASDANADVARAQEGYDLGASTWTALMRQERRKRRCSAPKAVIR